MASPLAKLRKVKPIYLVIGAGVAIAALYLLFLKPKGGGSTAQGTDTTGLTGGAGGGGGGSPFPFPFPAPEPTPTPAPIPSPTPTPSPSPFPNPFPQPPPSGSGGGSIPGVGVPTPLPGPGALPFIGPVDASNASYNAVWDRISGALAGANPKALVRNVIDIQGAAVQPMSAAPEQTATAEQYQALVLGQYAGGTGKYAPGAPVDVTKGLTSLDIQKQIEYLQGVQKAGAYNPDLPAIGNAQAVQSLIYSMQGALASGAYGPPPAASTGTGVEAVANVDLSKTNSNTPPVTATNKRPGT